MTRACVLAAFAAAFPVAVAAQTGGTSGPPALVVQGQGVVSRSPDEAAVSVAIETNDPSATSAQARNNSAFSAMLTALARVHVARGAVQSAGYDLRYVPPPEPTAAPEPSASSVHPLPVARNPRPGERYGYVVTRNVIISGLDPSRVGAVVDACAGAGATTISGVTFGVRDQRGAYEAALARALEDASAQARALAAAGHFRIVSLQRVESSGPATPGPVAFRAMSSADGTQIAPSNVETRATVSVTYAIAPD